MKDQNKELPTRSEEVQHIIDRIPTKFGYWTTILVVCIFISIFTLSWFINYHDVASGVIVISANKPPIKLVANSSGKIILYSKTNEFVEENAYIASIQNPTNVEHIVDLKKILNSFDPNNYDDLTALKTRLHSKKYSLGELNLRFFQFLSAVNLMVNYQEDKLYQKREENLIKNLTEFNKMLNSINSKLSYSQENTKFFRGFLQRDSGLLAKGAITRAEFNNSELNLLNALAGTEGQGVEVARLSQDIENTENKLKELSIEKKEKYIQLSLELVTASNELRESIKAWEEKFTFKSPISGNVQFLRFWVDNHFIQVGESIFTIVSNDNQMQGLLTLPSIGAGKVRVGQEVIIKLDEYPYMEFGSLKGVVERVSLTTNTEKVESGNVENYLISVSLPDNLITSYGRTLGKRDEIRGTADIVTNDRRLIQRVFDNLKYLFNN